MKKILFLISFYLEKKKTVEVGSRVSYLSVAETITGVVKSIKGDMALVASVVFNSDIMQWINIRNLRVIS